MTATVERPVAKESGMSPDARRRMGTAAVGVAAWIIGLLFVTPVLYMLLTSLHSEPAAATNPPSFLAPLTLESYANFFGAASGAPVLVESHDG